MTSSLAEIIEQFAGRRVLVVGDAILDHYVIGDVSRTSPEAPVPILAVAGEQWLPGGAANVARNIASLGAKVTFVSACGADESGDRLLSLLAETLAIKPVFQRGRDRPTTLKTRCVAQGQQMLRLDREVAGPLPSATAEKLAKSVEREMKRSDGVILSDYGKGILTPALIARIVSVARNQGIEVIVDPKGSNYRQYKGVTLITPNRREAEQASGVMIHDDTSTGDAARTLQKQIGGKAIIITLGAHGVAVFPQRGKPLRISARAREVFDVTGAGDTFIATLALARFSGATFSRAAELGNAAAGIVVGRSGVATITGDELKREVLGDIASRKLLSLQELVEVRNSLALAGRSLVFTNGCFDILNVRHIRLLEQARALGDVLLVALNSDESVRKIKGEPRPLLSAMERVDLISSLPYVDYVTVFEGNTPNDLLRKLKPDFLVKGDISEEVVGREIVEGYGGAVKLIEAGLDAEGDEILRRATDATPRRRRRK